MILKEPYRGEDIRKFFYEKYKDEICEKKFYFEHFFKEEFKEEKILLSQSQKKIATKSEINEVSIKKEIRSETKKVLSQSITKR